MRSNCLVLTQMGPTDSYSYISHSRFMPRIILHELKRIKRDLIIFRDIIFEKLRPQKVCTPFSNHELDLIIVLGESL